MGSGAQNEVLLGCASSGRGRERCQVGVGGDGGGGVVGRLGGGGDDSGGGKHQRGELSNGGGGVNRKGDG